MRLPYRGLTTVLLLLASQGFVEADPAAGNVSLDPPGLQPLISKANALLSAGQFGEAARTYTQAIEQTPASYLLYFKRATAYLSQSRHEPALADFDKVLNLTGGSFDKALLSKARIFAKEGRWSEARDALKEFTKKNRADTSAADVLFSVSEAEVASKMANKAKKSKQWDACLEEASKALQTATHSVRIRQLRVDCAMEKGDVEQAVGDLTRLTHLTAPSTSAMHRISSLAYYLLPSSTTALSTLKQCLHYDPDSRLCAPAHRQLKKFDRTFAKFQNAVSASEWGTIVKDGPPFVEAFEAAMEKALSGDGIGLPASMVPKKKSPKRRDLYAMICKAYIEINLPKKAESWCQEVLECEGGEGNVDALVGMGEASLAAEDYEGAVRYLERAFEASGRSSNEVHQRLQKAHRLLKQSKKKDYYKILGVARDADVRTIKKAYRKAAKSAHPDKGGSEKQMAALNEAYEVLSNEELRARYDNGDDPNDPSSQQGFGGYGNPFTGNPFHQFMFQQSHGGRGRGGPFGGREGFAFQFHT